MTATLLLLHLLGATIWTGGHLVLAVTILPRVLKGKDVAALHWFEEGYEKLGMPALVVQIITGLWLAWQKLPSLALWFSAEGGPVAQLIQLKLALLGLTALVAAHARFRVIPRLSPATLPLMGWHILAVTLLSVLFVVVGLSFRVRWSL
ncbi:CopD family protein [Halomonas rhizosphaerae]|uniref:CopD family protein n=1 Tax=Halomonas rhizosphaerae TaxID=3043296 RepID=A0ABT6V1I0_9GAMM|nr:CopD family protein [Halomonas rhizosphaerae]MDI5891333.1 CopD family protein [Halomonas rhizosphaerae]